MLPLRFPVAALTAASLLSLPLGAHLAQSEALGDVPTAISHPSSVQGEERSPGDIILQAIRAVESGDSSLLVRWRRELESGGADQGAYPSLVTGEATLGLAVAAWATYRYGEAEERLGLLIEGTGPADPIAPFAWIVRGEIEVAQARLLQSDSAFSRALAISEELGVSRARAWSLIRLANVRGRLTGTPDVSARLFASAEPLLDPEDDFLRGQFHCGRAGNDPTGVWTTEADARAGLDFALKAGVRRLHAACLHVLASDQIRRGRALDALDTFRDEQAEQKAIGDRSGRAATLQWAGYVLFTLGDFATSRSYLLEAVSEGEASGNLSPVAWAYLSLSGIAAGLGNLAGATEYLDEAERLLVEQGDQWGLSTLRGRRAVVAFAVGDWETAREFWNATLEEHRRSGNVVGALGAQTGLLELAIAEGDLDAADQVLAAARSTARSSGMGEWEVSFLFHEAEIALQRGAAAEAREALEQFLLPGQFSVRTYMAQARYAEALALEGRITDAADVLESSLDALEGWRSGLDPAGLQVYAFQIGEHVADPDLGIASVLSAMVDSGQVRRAFDLAERQRARHLYERMVLAEIGRLRSVDDTHEVPSIPPPQNLDATGVLAAIPDKETAIVEFVT
ncbi:MAG: hypothetical protein MUO50_13595, partial [Longimicrobiales bacterium]|nr:hypothetical protein [Longimicrobiales bacterium]